MSTFKITGTITDADGSTVDFTAIDTPDYNKVVAMSGMGSVGALSTAPGGIIVLPTAPLISNIRTVSGTQTFWNVSNGGTTFSNNHNAHGTSVYSGATVSVYLGGSLAGSTTTAGNGDWAYAFGILADGAYTLSVTITVGGLTSLFSSNFNFTIVTPIQSFTNVVQANMTIDNILYELFATGGSGNATKAYSFQKPDSHTLRFEVVKGDNAPGDSSGVDRSEIGQPGAASGGILGIPNRAMRWTHEFLIESGGPNTANGFFIIYQVHNDDVTAGVGTSPFFSLMLCGAGNTQSAGDHVGVQYRWWNSGLGAISQSTIAIVDAYISPGTITRGVWHTVDVNSFINNSGTGILQVWIDGAQVVNLTNINYGYGFNYYSEFGIYRGTCPIADDEAVQDRNMILSLITS